MEFYNQQKTNRKIFAKYFASHLDTLHLVTSFEIAKITFKSYNMVINQSFMRYILTFTKQPGVWKLGVLHLQIKPASRLMTRWQIYNRQTK